MGCISNSPHRQFSSQFLYDQQITIESAQNLPIKPLKPLYSTLYNILRKSSTTQIIHSSSQPQLLRNSTRPDIGQISSSQLKVLYSFKNILIIGKLQPYKRIPRQISLKNLYLISYKQCQYFLKKFPIFGALGFNKEDRDSKRLSLNGRNNISAISTTPILVFIENQIVKNKSNSNPKTMYIHAKKYKNDKYYQLLKIDTIIQLPNQQKIQQQISYFMKQLQKPYDSVLILHEDSLHQNELRKILVTHIAQKYKIQDRGVYSYLMRILPGNQGILNNNSQIIEKNNQKVFSPTISPPNQQLSSYTKILKSFYQQSSLETVERAYNVLLLLISNIYTYPEKQSYRQVKTRNKNIENISRHKSGKKLLNQLGWKENSQNFWVNDIDCKYLKIFRIDLQVAYSRFKEEIKK